MHTPTKVSLLSVINKVTPLEDYNPSDHIFSERYRISATDMVYILQSLAAEYNIVIDDALIDSLEICTFGQLEKLIA